jgi:hypothetical protein
VNTNHGLNDDDDITEQMFPTAFNDETEFLNYNNIKISKLDYKKNH